MNLEYKDGELIEEKKPYDSVELWAMLKVMGVKKSTRMRKDRALFIQTDIDLTTDQKAQLETYLKTIDLTKSLINEDDLIE